MTSPLDNITAEIEYIDAAAATALLATQKINRVRSKATVNSYYNDILAKRWGFNGEPIKIDRDGHLIDGQHRLAAIERTAGTGLTIPILVVRGLPPEAQLTMDQGRKRNAAQQLGLIDVADAPSVAAGARVYLLWTSGDIWRNNVDQTITASAIAEWVESHPEEVDLIQTSRKSPFSNISARPAVTSAVFVRLHLANSTAAGEFFTALATGANLAPDSPILALKNRMDRAKMNREQLTTRDGLGLYMIAWNAWRKGRPLSKVAIPTGGWTPEKLEPLD